MGKQRGFKPQGMINPMMMARKVQNTGPTIADRMARANRPSWEDLRKMALKKTTTSSEFLEQWENDNFQEELAAEREKIRGGQEEQHLKEIRKEAKRKRKQEKKLTHDGSDSGTDEDRSAKRSSSHRSRSPSSRKRHKKKRKKDSSRDKSYKLSSFLKGED
eukprot:GHVN01102596.1.p1 GENE.GHVN01102596.1~~GHVN01102596.1.p1  ORF type:complete len:161 (-),score=16.17 GHVN01102596.1:85-567(-)